MLSEKEKNLDACLCCFMFDLETIAISSGGTVAENIFNLIKRSTIEYEKDCWRFRREDEPYIHPDNRRD